MQHLLARLAIVICGLFALMIATSGISFAVASLPTAEDVVRAEIKAEGQHNYQRITVFGQAFKIIRTTRYISLTQQRRIRIMQFLIWQVLV